MHTIKNTELDNWLVHFLGSKKALFLSAVPEPTAVRVNTLRSSVAEFQSRLNQLGVAYNPISFNTNGFVIPEDSLPLSHTLDFFCGKIQYQGIASQLPALVLNPQPGERVLDMAAADSDNQHQVLINLTDTVPMFFSRFERVTEIVPANEKSRHQARERYKFYQQRGYELETHKLSK